MRTDRKDDGIALVIVLSVLTMLLVIATPFLLQARKDRRGAVIAADHGRARAIAESAVDYAKLSLERTHQGLERAGGGAATPFWDDASELTVDAWPADWSALTGSDGTGYRYFGNPRGNLWSIDLRDEQALIDADSAPPFLWAALVGRGTLGRDVTPSDARIDVDDASGFSPDGGELIIDGEIVPYRKIEGGSFVGVSMRRNHAAGAWVLNRLALDLAVHNYKSSATPGQYRGMASPTSLKQVLGWSEQKFDEVQLADIMRPLTVHAQRLSPEGWLAPVRVIGTVDPQAFNPESGGQPVRVNNPDYFNAGTVVRLGSGTDWEYHVVTRVSARGADGVIYLLEPAGRVHAADTSVLQAEMRHPVNVNAASKDVLVMLLEGLEYNPNNSRTSNPNDRVSSEVAQQVAAVIERNRPVRGVRHLVGLLAVMHQVAAGTYEGPIDGVSDAEVSGGGRLVPLSPRMALAIVQNAINANHRALVNSTMPFAYASHDTFRIEAQASVNTQAGEERGRYRLRETFRTAPAEELVFRLDTQVDFEEAITTLRAGRYVETHPVPMTVPISGNSKPEWRVLRNMTWFERANRGGLFASETEGDLRLQPSRLETVGAADFEEHFDGQVIGEAAIGLPQNPSTVTPDLIVPEGWPLRTGAFPLPVTTGSGAAPGSANVRDALGLVPFVVRFWMKPDTFGAGPAIFSMSGDDPNADFIECRYDPGDASFHFRVHDNTLDDPATGLVEAAEVVWTPPPTMLEDDTWFHFSLHCQGTNPEDLVLLVDGFRRGQNRFVSRLTSAMSETAMSFEVEDATGWPDQGAFWIGTEVVNAYRQAGRNSYTVFQGSNSFLPKGRGARGTTAASHLQAEVVRLFGYSSVLTKSAGRRLGGEVISEGHGALVSALAPLDLCSVTGVDTDVLMVGPVSIGVEVLDLAQTSQIDLEVFGGGNIATQQLTFQESGGYALIVAPLFPAAGSGNLPNNQNLQNQLEWVAQLIKYQGRQGNRLTGITLASQTYNTELSDQQVLNNDITLYTATGAKIVTRFSGGGPNSPGLSGIFPLSVHLTDVEGYKDPESTAGGQVEPEYIQLGQPLRVPTLQNFSSHSIEWLAYYGVDRASRMLICNGFFKLRDGANAVRTELANSGAFNVGAPPSTLQPPDLSTLRAGLEFRALHDTAQFGWTDPQNGSHTHAAGNAAIPVFRTESMDLLNGVTPADYGDSCTLVSPGGQTKIQRYVAWAYDNLFAFTDNVLARLDQIPLPINGRSRDDRDRRRYVRIVKFPSGELPGMGRSTEAWVGGDLGGRVRGGGLVDEVRLASLEEDRFVLWDPGVLRPVGGPPTPFPIGISDSDTDIPIVSAWWVPGLPGPNSGSLADDWLPDGRELLTLQSNVNLPTDGGVIMIDDEMIAYRGVSPGTPARLVDCTRGYMGTIPAAHSYGANVTFLDWRVVSKLTNQLQPDDFRINVEDSRGFSQTGGAALINQEMVHWTRALGGSLEMPRKLDARTNEERGIFRGRYGSQRGSHAADDLVLDMPFRYWDRYAEDSDDPELGFFEFAINEPRAFFRRIEWTTRFKKSRIGLRVLLRFDSRTAWDTPPQDSQGRLRLFDSERGVQQARKEVQMLNLNGKGVEGRVFFTFGPDSFDAVLMERNDWKETPELLDLELRYLAAPSVLSREELR